MTSWGGQPAIGVALAKLVELHARLLRVDAEKKRRAAERVVMLMRKASK